MKIFGPGTISTGDFEFNTTFTPDSQTVFFTRATVDFSHIAIFSAKRLGNGWTAAAPVIFSGCFRDTDPFVSPDGKKLYFCSDRPVGALGKPNGEYSIYYAELAAGNIISPPIYLPIPGVSNLFYPSVAASGNLYFSVFTGQDADIYMSAWHDGKYENPVKLKFNTSNLADFDPVVASDESFIIFTSSNRKGYGSTDLWISFRIDGNWNEPVNMGATINSSGREATPGLSPDNQTLYFSAYREKANGPLPDCGTPASNISGLLHSVWNGLPNIYQISISDIKQPEKSNDNSQKIKSLPKLKKNTIGHKQL